MKQLLITMALVLSFSAFSKEHQSLDCSAMNSGKAKEKSSSKEKSSKAKVKTKSE